MPSLTNELYEFGEFRVDPHARLLSRREEVVALTPKAFDLLLLLIRHSGEVISKDELMKAVWPDSFVEESNLTQTVFMLRKALGETPGQRYILTIQGRGDGNLGEWRPGWPSSATGDSHCQISCGDFSIPSSRKLNPNAYPAGVRRPGCKRDRSGALAVPCLFAPRKCIFSGAFHCGAPTG